MVTHDAFTASYASRVIFIKDGKIFRTTDNDGVPTPDMSTLDMKITRLEDYTLPANDVE